MFEISTEVFEISTTLFGKPKRGIRKIVKIIIHLLIIHLVIQVIKKIEEFYENANANPHRGAYLLSIEATQVYEEARDKIAKFINAKHREEVIFSKNATESLNLIAYSYGMDNLKKETEVVISIIKH